MSHVARATIRLLILGCCVLLTALTQVVNATGQAVDSPAGSEPLPLHSPDPKTS